MGVDTTGRMERGREDAINRKVEIASGGGGGGVDAIKIKEEGRCRCNRKEDRGNERE